MMESLEHTFVGNGQALVNPLHNDVVTSVQVANAQSRAQYALTNINMKGKKSVYSASLYKNMAQA